MTFLTETFTSGIKSGKISLLYFDIFQKGQEEMKEALCCSHERITIGRALFGMGLNDFVSCFHLKQGIFFDESIQSTTINLVFCNCVTIHGHRTGQIYQGIGRSSNLYKFSPLFDEACQFI